MAVQNIECQIARGQMSRYLSGDSFSPDMAVDLRAHISECPDCAQSLEQKRQILQTMLSAAGNRVAVQIEEPTDETNEPEPAETSTRRQSPWLKQLVNRLSQGRSPRSAVARLEPCPSAKSQWKPLLYSGGLALVLFAMSFLMRDPTRLFGDRASESVTPPSLSSDTGKIATGTKVPKTSTAPTARQTSKPSLSATPANKNAPPSSRSAETANTSARPNPSSQPRNRPAKKAVDQAARPPAKRTEPPQGIRLYDANGNPIG